MAYGDEPEYDPRSDPDPEVRRRFNDPNDSFVPKKPYQRRKDEPFDEDYDPRTDPNPEVRRRYHEGEGPVPDRPGQG